MFELDILDVAAIREYTRGVERARGYRGDIFIDPKRLYELHASSAMMTANLAIFKAMENKGNG